MADPLSTGASAVTILHRITAALRWMWRRLPRALPTGSDHGRASGLEIRPVHYRIHLTAKVPQVEITLYAINYHRQRLDLRELKVSRFNAGNLPAFDNIPLAFELGIEPRSSRLVHCQRALVDAEARAATTASSYPALTGSLNLLARGIVKGKEVTFQATAQVVEGCVLVGAHGAA